MKKNFFLYLVGVIAVLIGFSSCKQCQTCTYDGDVEEFCQDEFDSKAEYRAYIRELESYGAKCR